MLDVVLRARVEALDGLRRHRLLGCGVVGFFPESKVSLVCFAVDEGFDEGFGVDFDEDVDAAGPSRLGSGSLHGA